VYTGVDYPYPAPLRTFNDGTTDGLTNNYLVDYVTGGVYATNLDWSGLLLLFPTGLINGAVLGITYDASNNSLWVSGFDNDDVINHSMAGLVLSSFSTGFNAITSLALDPADGTLWMGTQNNFGTFSQFSKAGVLLDTVTYANMAGQNTLGGEFNIEPAAAPEPTTPALISVVVAGWLFRRRRRVSVD
jgi:hypothetical protein